MPPPGLALEVLMSYEQNKKASYYLAYRSVFSDDYLKPEKPFSRFEAWQWLLSTACRKEEGRHVTRKVSGSERLIFEPYASITHSLRYLASQWGWTEKKVRTYIQKLQKKGTAIVEIKQSVTQITLCNLDSYQNRGRGEGEARARRGRGEGEARAQVLSGSIRDNRTSSSNDLEISKDFKPAHGATAPDGKPVTLITPDYFCTAENKFVKTDLGGWILEPPETYNKERFLEGVKQCREGLKKGAK